MGQKFDDEGAETYRKAVEAVSKFINNTLKGQFLVADRITMADFTAANFIFGVVFNENFPMQAWA